jgi:MYXO-CTERM domain-containing protein
MLVIDADAQQVFGNTTLINAITLPRAYAGVLQTCDIYFNGPSASWSVDPVVQTNHLDVETVALHEAGHCLGLGHSGPTESVMDQVVAKGEAVRVLAPADVQKLCGRYPVEGELGSPCFGDGGCQSSTLRCLPQPITNGLSLNLCSSGCTLGSGSSCTPPLSCLMSAAFPGFTGACVLPGNIVTAVGKNCTDATQCGNSFGICAQPEVASGGHFFWTDGYCTQACEVGQPVCPAGSACVPIDVGMRCLQSCRVGMADCRPDYACAQIDAIGTTGVCVSRCYADQDCADPGHFTCRTCDGLCVARQALNGNIGDVCLDDTTCGAGQVCRVTSETSGQKQCTEQCSRGCGLCPTGSTCSPGARGELFCLRDCTGPGTCPIGLRCADTTVGRSCQPACSVNTDCPVGQGCFMGECYTAQEYDAGCTTLTCKPDAGKPIVVTPKDAGTGSGGTGGCGCTSVDPSFGFALLGLLTFGARRRSWRQR